MAMKKAKKRKTSRPKKAKARPVRKKKRSKKKVSRASRKKAVKARPKPQKEKGQLIGSITHYFPHVEAAVLVVKQGTLKNGDTILIKGHTTRFEEIVESMQIDRAPIAEAKKGDEIGLRVRERVREHDQVYKINPK